MSLLCSVNKFSSVLFLGESWRKKFFRKSHRSNDSITTRSRRSISISVRYVGEGICRSLSNFRWDNANIFNSIFYSSLSHSKLKKKNIFCALCHGPVELFRIRTKNGKRMTVALRKPGSFALFVKENYRLLKTPEMTHAGVMRALSESYSKLTVAQKQKYRSSFLTLKWQHSIFLFFYLFFYFVKFYCFF